jgi:hypothetical protein
MVELACHPGVSSRALQGISARATRTREGRLSLHYSLKGDIARVVVPPPQPARIGWKLWRHTCCEAFIRPEGGEAYWEFNFSPSGEWAAYAFGGYREGAALAEAALDPQIALERDAGKLDLYALLDLRRLSISGPLRLGLSAVIEEQDGNVSYWALRHPAARPDFHHADSFALGLDEVRD